MGAIFLLYFSSCDFSLQDVSKNKYQKESPIFEKFPIFAYQSQANKRKINSIN